MATAEELRIKEQLWQQEILFLQSKCKSLEDRVDQRIAHESQGGLESSDLREIKKDISDTTKNVGDLKLDLTKWFQTINDEIEVAKQYSCQNNGILEGMENVPNINGYAFICYIAQALTNLFPSLCTNYGPVLPIHIDAAHPLPSKRGRSVIIVKFVNRWMKELLVEHQDDLPHHVRFSEHITHHTRELLSSAQDIVGKENAVIYKTAVFAKLKG